MLLHCWGLLLGLRQGMAIAAVWGLLRQGMAMLLQCWGVGTVGQLSN